MTMASFICPSRFSAASIRVRAEMGLAGFHKRGMDPVTSVLGAGTPVPSGRGKRLGISTEAKDSTRFTASADAAENRDDSFPAISIPRVIMQVYSRDGL